MIKYPSAGRAAQQGHPDEHHIYKVEQWILGCSRSRWQAGAGHELPSALSGFLLDFIL